MRQLCWWCGDDADDHSDTGGCCVYCDCDLPATVIKKLADAP